MTCGIMLAWMCSKQAIATDVWRYVCETAVLQWGEGLSLCLTSTNPENESSSMHFNISTWWKRVLQGEYCYHYNLYWCFGGSGTTTTSATTTTTTTTTATTIIYYLAITSYWLRSSCISASPLVHIDKFVLVSHYHLAYLAVTTRITEFKLLGFRIDYYYYYYYYYYYHHHHHFLLYAGYPHTYSRDKPCP